MKKNPNKKTRKIKEYHKVITLSKKSMNENNDKKLNKTRKRCLTDNDVSKLCSTGQYSQYTKNFYNKDNINKINLYVNDLDARFKKYRKYKIPMEKRTHHMIDKFDFLNDNIEKNKLFIRNNFYDYVNQQWFKETVIEDRPKFYVQVDNFRVIQEKVYYQLIDNIKTYIKENPKSEKAIAIKNLYDSMTTKSTKHISEHVKRITGRIDEYINPDTPTNMYDLLLSVIVIRFI